MTTRKVPKFPDLQSNNGGKKKRKIIGTPDVNRLEYPKLMGEEGIMIKQNRKMAKKLRSRPNRA